MDLASSLLPPPRHLQLTGGSWTIPRSFVVSPPPEVSPDSPGLRRLRRALLPWGAQVELTDSPHDNTLGFTADPRLDSEAYHLEITPRGVDVRASTSAGFYYALCTLAQCLQAVDWETGPTPVPCLLIQDRPDFRERGVSLDVARGKRPTLPTLFELVERLSSWKINQLQLYMEADFAYSNATAALDDRSPYTAEEIRRLDAHCRLHHVELVPNQQSLGHLHAWLRHEPWRHLAEVPDGVEHPFSREREPFSLAANTPDTLDFLDKLYGELLPNFSSARLNVGLDETFDLGEGRSAEACRARGKHRVYLDHLQSVHELAARHHKRVQFWGDIVLEEPSVIPDLPADSTALVWGYEADFPFEERLPAFAKSGLPFLVCPGTSSWNSFGGRVTNALGNLKKAAREARSHGAEGLLITDWGDRGHLQPWPTTFLGFACGAAFAWKVDATDSIGLDTAAQLLDRHAFEDRAGVSGSAWVELGRVTDVLGDDCENGHALFFACTFADTPFPHPRVVGLTPAGLDAARDHLQGLEKALANSRCQPEDSSLLRDEWDLAWGQLALAESFCRVRLGLATGNTLADLPSRERSTFQRTIQELGELSGSVWSRRHRPGGLVSSLRWLDFIQPSRS